jgi:hypothetical protein
VNQARRQVFANRSVARLTAPLTHSDTTLDDIYTYDRLACLESSRRQRHGDSNGGSSKWPLR